MSIIEIVKHISDDYSTKNHSYYILKKYEVLPCGDVEIIIKIRLSSDDPILYYVKIEDSFSVIKKAHILLLHHGGRDRILKHIATKYANIGRE